MQAYRKPQAVVLTSEGVFYDNGRHHPLSDKVPLTSLPAVLGGAHRLYQGSEGVCMLDSSILAAGDSLTLLRDWKFSELRAWTTFVHRDGTVVHLGLLPELGERLGGVLQGVSDPMDIARRLGSYHQLTGVHWRATPGITGCAALRKAFPDPTPGAQPLWHHPLLKGVRLRGCGPLIWRNPQQPTPDDRNVVHVFDINAMYLAGLRNAQLAWSALQRSEIGRFDPSMPGYWEIDVTGLPADLYDGKTRPPVFPKMFSIRGSAWLSTPVVKYLVEVTGLHFDVMDAYVSDNPQGIGRGVAERLMAARRGDLGDPGPLLPAIKRTYAELVGMLARERGSIYRPDWAATIMDLARMNMLRRVRRLDDDVRILAVETDAVYLMTDAPNAALNLSARLGVGTEPGTFKYVESLTVGQYLKKMNRA